TLGQPGRVRSNETLNVITLSAALISVTATPVRTFGYAAVEGVVVGVNSVRHPERNASSGLPPPRLVGGSSRSWIPSASSRPIPFLWLSPSTTLSTRVA